MSSRCCGGNASRVTSGFSCFNNLLVQVTPLNYPNRIFWGVVSFLLMIYWNTLAATNGLWPKQSRTKTPSALYDEQILGESKLKAAEAKNKRIQRSHILARLYYCLWRCSIWEIWPQSWEEAVFATRALIRLTDREWPGASIISSRQWSSFSEVAAFFFF